MKSMTGYGKGECQYNGLTLTIELKSVNHRFLDLAFKMPRLFGCCEDSLRNHIKNIFTRGHIDIFVNYTTKGADDSNVTINMPLAKKYLELAKQLTKQFNIPNDLTVDKLLSKQNVVMSGEQVIDDQELTNALMSGLTTACQNLLIMRETEGISTKTLLLDKMDSITISTQAIESFIPIQMKTMRAKLKARIDDALGDVKLDEQRLMNEIVFYSDKLAIDEEFTRLYAHVQHFIELTNSQEPVGRQLDFIVQEMNREANTIGSKCNDLSISNHVLQLKTDIEKVREQVQNIE